MSEIDTTADESLERTIAAVRVEERERAAVLVEEHLAIVCAESLSGLELTACLNSTREPTLSACLAAIREPVEETDDA